MSNFACEKCGTVCSDAPHGYTTGCGTHPPDIGDTFTRMLNQMAAEAVSAELP